MFGPRILWMFLVIRSVYSGTHSLKYFYTGSSGMIEFPEFVVVGLVDDEQFVYFGSNDNKFVPRVEWIAKSEGADYWERETEKQIGAAQTFKASIGILTQRFNQTGGIHTLQTMYGCERDDDGTTRGFYQFGYDGDDYISFDKKTLTWTAANQRGQTTKVKWDPDTAFNQQKKGYLEGTCIEWLKKYVTYGEKTLERQARPEVFMSYKRTKIGTEATCHVTGFFPRDIEVIWHNGGPRDLDVESGEVLPNDDGTYQVKKILKLSVNKEDLKKGQYSCRVAHSSFPGNQEVTIPFDPEMRNPNEPSESFPVWIILVVVGILLAVAAICAGVFIWMKKNSSGAKNLKYTQAQSAESSPNGSTNGV